MEGLLDFLGCLGFTEAQAGILAATPFGEDLLRRQNEEPESSFRAIAIAEYGDLRWFLDEARLQLKAAS
jgi:hypothetical protein